MYNPLSLLKYGSYVFGSVIHLLETHAILVTQTNNQTDK